MDLRLNGRRALVTGSSSGPGRATADLLAGDGVTVVVHGRDRARTTAVADGIRSDGGEAEVAIGDLATDDAAYDALSWAEATPEVRTERPLNPLNPLRRDR